MSLDVYLLGEKKEEKCICPNCDNEHTRIVQPELFWMNITHNLNSMAADAGIYVALWRPESAGITKAEQLIDPLRKGLELLKNDPDRFKAFSPANGWGTYKGLVEFVEAYLHACEEYPDAAIYVSR